MRVKDLDLDHNFIVDSQDVQAIKDYLGKDLDYDSFFVKTEDGDYTEVYGMYGIIPYLSNYVYKVE